MAPHPDDESIGAPCTLLTLRDAGWRIVNVAVGLGSVDQRRRRRDELEEACRRTGFELLVLDPPANISRASNPDDHEDLTDRLAAIFAELRPAVVVGPSPTDGHHGHEITGTAIVGAVERQTTAIRLWQWGLWADLAGPNVFVPVTAEHLDAAKHAVSAHEGELARNNYLDLLEARARVAAILGAERVFGWGAPGQSERYAELLREVEWDGRAAHVPVGGRRLEPADPLGGLQSGS